MYICGITFKYPLIFSLSKSLYFGIFLAYRSAFYYCDELFFFFLKIGDLEKLLHLSSWQMFGIRVIFYIMLPTFIDFLKIPLHVLFFGLFILINILKAL